LPEGIDSRVFEVLCAVVRIELTALAIGDGWTYALLVRVARNGGALHSFLCMVEECLRSGGAAVLGSG
jgi:hypothetical protein